MKRLPSHVSLGVTYDTTIFQLTNDSFDRRSTSANLYGQSYLSWIMNTKVLRIIDLQN